MTTNVSQRVLNIYRTLSKSHKKLAKLVLHDCEEIATLTADRLARAAGVSPSTVIRFALKLGYNSFSDFQAALLDFLNAKRTPADKIRISNAKISRKDVIEASMTSDITKIRNTFDNLNRNAFFKFTDAIIEAECVYIISGENTEQLAYVLYQTLNLALDKVVMVKLRSESDTFSSLLTLTPKDVVIAFDFSKYSKLLIDVTKYSKNTNAKILAIADSDLAPVAEYSTLLLVAKTDAVPYMNSLVAPLALVNAISVEISRRCEGELLQKLDKLEMLCNEYGENTKR